MVFTIKKKKKKKLEELYERAMKEVGEFFEVNWVRNRPKMYLVSDRETIDALRGRETPRWLVGWGGARTGGVYILDSENFAKESQNSYSPERWDALVKHELVHCFYDVVTGMQRKPKWLSEGVATCLSGQNQWHKPLDKFERFLECYEVESECAYSEGGFVVEVLVDRFGREKLLRLLRGVKEQMPDEEGFGKLFKEVYGIELSYKELNKLLEARGSN